MNLKLREPFLRLHRSETQIALLCPETFEIPSRFLDSAPSDEDTPWRVVVTRGTTVAWYITAAKTVAGLCVRIRMCVSMLDADGCPCTVYLRVEMCTGMPAGKAHSTG